MNKKDIFLWFVALLPWLLFAQNNNYTAVCLDCESTYNLDCDGCPINLRTTETIFSGLEIRRPDGSVVTRVYRPYSVVRVNTRYLLIQTRNDSETQVVYYSDIKKYNNTVITSLRQLTDSLSICGKYSFTNTDTSSISLQSTYVSNDSVFTVWLKPDGSTEAQLNYILEKDTSHNVIQSIYTSNDSVFTTWETPEGNVFTELNYVIGSDTSSIIIQSSYTSNDSVFTVWEKPDGSTFTELNYVVSSDTSYNLIQSNYVSNDSVFTVWEKPTGGTFSELNYIIPVDTSYNIIDSYRISNDSVFTVWKTPTGEFIEELAYIKKTPNVTEVAVSGQTPFTNPPSAPTEGDEFLNTIDNLSWVYDGLTWVERVANIDVAQGIKQVGGITVADFDTVQVRRIVSDVAALTNLATPLGSRVTSESNGVTYDIRVSEPIYYPADNNYVIAKSDGTYAIADLSNRRKFDSKAEFKNLVHFLKIKEGENIVIGGVDYEVSFAYKKFYSSLSQSAFNDRAVDGFFVDTVTIHNPHKNLFYYSEELKNSTETYPSGSIGLAIFLNGNAGVIPQNAAIAPDGTRTAERLFGFNSTASNQLQIKGNVAALLNGLQIGDTLTYSFYYRGDKTTGSNERFTSMNVTSVTTSMQTINFTLDGEWHRGSSFGVVTGLTSGSSFTFGVLSGFANNDTLDVWGFQLERGRLSEYQKATWENTATVDRLYLYQTGLIENNVLDLSKVVTGNSAGTVTAKKDAAFIQSAIDYCAEGERCNIVKLPIATFYLDQPIVMKRGVTLEGSYDGYRQYGSNNPFETATTTLYITYRDTSSYAFTFAPYGSMNVLDNSGLRNLTILARDSIAGFVRTEEITGCHFEQVTCTTSSSGTPYVANRAWSIETNPSSDNHYNYFRKVSASANPNTGIGLVYEGGVGNEFYDCAFTGDISVQVENGLFRAIGLSVETGNTGLYIKGGESFVDALYTESSAYNGGSTVLMNGTGSLVISNSRLQSENATDTLFNLKAGNHFGISDSEILLTGVAYISESFPSLSFKGVGSVSELRNYLNLEGNLLAITSINGNYNTYANDNAIYHNSDGNKAIQSSAVYESVISNTTFSDTIGLSNIVLKGDRVNLLNKSEDHLPDVASTFYNSYNNIATDPQGGLTADVVSIHTSTTASTSYVTKSFPSNLESGKVYTVSVWLKNLGPQLPRTQVQFRVGLTPTVSFDVQSDDWVRYEKSFRIETPSSSVFLRLNKPLLGDSIAVWGWQVNEGYFATSYVPTTTTGIIDTTVNIVASGNQNININSPLNLTTGLKFGDSAGTTGQIIISQGGAVNTFINQSDLLVKGMDEVVAQRSYVDNTAATGAGLGSGQVYYNTTSSTFVVIP